LYEVVVELELVVEPVCGDVVVIDVPPVEEAVVKLGIDVVVLLLEQSMQSTP